MKLLPHNKNVGLIFFAALILTAIFLFIFDKSDSKKDVARDSAQDRLRDSAEGGLGGSENNATFAQVDWQSSLTDGIPGTPDGEAVYDPAVLTRIEKPNTTDFKTYAADLKYALRRYADPKLGNEVAIMIRAYTTKDESLLDGITKLQNNHRDSIADLLKVRVPEETTTYHARVMSSLKALIAVDENLRTIFTSPEIASSAATLYTHNTVQFYQALAAIGKVVEDKGVTLTSKEKLALYLNVEQ